MIDGEEGLAAEWWNKPVHRWRLYVESFTAQGYYLIVSLPPPDGRSYGPQPYPFLKPEVNSILEELEKTQPDRDKIEVALLRFDQKVLSQIKKCFQDQKARQARLLLGEYDLRFSVLTDEMWNNLESFIAPKRGAPKKPLRLFVERWIVQQRIIENGSAVDRSKVAKDIYFAAKREGLTSEYAKDRRLIRDALLDILPEDARRKNVVSRGVQKKRTKNV
jgi:hypothetical protein